MGSIWQIIAFPVILPWREEFWTLPLYFPDLKLGVIPGWPPQLPFQGMPLPREAEVHPRELQHLNPGDLRQWQAYEEYRRTLTEQDDLLAALRTYGQPAAPEPPSAAPDAWSLAWQLEKMQADQEAQLQLVDKGQDWLQDILKPEPWDNGASFGPVPGVEEMADPELAALRYRLWRRVMAPYLQGQAAPLLLGRNSRALVLALKDWPNWTALRRITVALPGCRSGAEYLEVRGDAPRPSWQQRFLDGLAGVLTALAENQDQEASVQQLQELVQEEIVASWPFPGVWNWDLEIWAPEAAPEQPGPVLCWGGAGAGVLPH
jgi:hypothetical protein